MVFRAQRRFIAGAVCPKCAAMDKLVMFKENNKIFRECVSCGYHQEMQASPRFEALPTRVDPVKETSDFIEPTVVKSEVIRLVDSDKKD